MSCKGCGNPACGDADTGGEAEMFLYRTKGGENVFTGFVQRAGGAIYWIGKGTKTRKRGRLIRMDDAKDRKFFMTCMSQYDGYGE